MGYRSDVTVLLYCSTKVEAPELELFVKTNWPENDFLALERLERAQRLAFQLKLEGVKWYEGYPEVDDVNQFLEKLDNVMSARYDAGQPCSWAYEFARVGEDYEDIEMRRSEPSEYLLHVVRHIESEF